MEFLGDRLHLARVLCGLSLEDLGARLSVSRQYVHQMEIGTKRPNNETITALANILCLEEQFFARPLTSFVRQEDCHFRRLLSAPRSVIAHAMAVGTLIEGFFIDLENEVRLPLPDFPAFETPKSLHSIEAIATSVRNYWGLGKDGPITNMTRVLENAGAVVVHSPTIAEQIDAVSISRRRPIVIRSNHKAAACRVRFDLAHECAHLVLHQSFVTGSHETEEQAHRFAGAFLIPREAFAREYPRSKRGFDWISLLEMKRRWRVSLRAIVRRAFNLGIISVDQYRYGNIHLMKTGQSKTEKLDDIIEPETPELLFSAIQLLSTRVSRLQNLLKKQGLTRDFFEKMTGERIPIDLSNVLCSAEKWQKMP